MGFFHSTDNEVKCSAPDKTTGYGMENSGQAQEAISRIVSLRDGVRRVSGKSG